MGLPVPDTNIRTLVEILLKDVDKLEQASRGMDRLDHAADKAQKSTTKTGKATQELGQMIGQYLGAAAVGAFIKGSISEFAKLDRQMTALGDTMQRLGLGGPAELGKVRDALEGLALGGGPLMSETIPAFQKFIGITKNTDTAMAAVKLAADVSEKGITDMGGAVAGVTAILQGKARSAAMSFGLELRKANGAVKTNKELMEELVKVTGGFSDTTADAADQVDVLAAQWEGLKVSVGKGLAPVLQYLNAILFHGVAVAKDLGDVLGWLVNAGIAGFRTLGGVIAAAFDFKKLVSDPAGYGMALNKALGKAAEEQKAAWDVMAEGVLKNHTRLAASTVDLAKGTADLITQAGKASSEEEQASAEKAAEKRKELETKTQAAIWAAKIAMAKEGSQEQLDLALAAKDAEKEAALKEAREVGADLAAIDQQYFLEKQAIISEFHQRWLESSAEAAKERAEKEREIFLAGLDAQRAAAGMTREAENAAETADLDARSEQRQAWGVDLMGREFDLAQESLDMRRRQETESLDQEYQDKLTAALQSGDQEAAALVNSQDYWTARKSEIDAGYTADSERLGKQRERAERERNIGMARGAVATMRSVFGNRKEFAIAEAIINTYEGATQALAAYPPPWSFIMAALVVAAGLQQVAQIRKQSASGSPGGAGFDDPQNDRLAYLGGRKWARDLVAYVSSGFGDELKRTATAFQAGPVVNIQPEAMAALAQSMAPAGTDRTPTATGTGGAMTVNAPGGPSILVNVGNLYGGDEGLKQLHRTLVQIARLDQNRVVGG